MRKQKPSSPPHKPTGENAEIVVKNLQKIVDAFNRIGQSEINWKVIGDLFEVTRDYPMSRENTRQLKNINHAVTLLSITAWITGIDISFLWNEMSQDWVDAKVEQWRDSSQSGGDLKLKFAEFIKYLKNE